MVKIINEILYSKKPLRNKVSRFRIFFLANSRNFGITKYLIWQHSQKLITAKMFNSSDLIVISRKNYFFLQNFIIHLFIDTFLIKLIFYPCTRLNQLQKEKYIRKVNRQKLGKKLKNQTVSRTIFQVGYLYPTDIIISCRNLNKIFFIDQFHHTLEY